MERKLYVIKKCRVVMMTFGGLQRYWMRSGDIHYFDSVVEWNSGYVITKAGLNHYTFQRQGVSMRCPAEK